MFANIIIEEVYRGIKTQIDTLPDTDAEIVPYDEVYPTSGKQFVRLYGARDLITYEETNVKVCVSIQIAVSRRIQTSMVQQRHVDYLKLISLAESTFMFILTSNSIIRSIANRLPENASMYGRFTSSMLDLKPGRLHARDYHSQENAERGPVGMELVQEFSSPIIDVPLNCFMTPDSLVSYFASAE
jgi:hypothetical protein